jgi:hypothetical protein
MVIHDKNKFPLVDGILEILGDVISLKIYGNGAIN